MDRMATPQEDAAKVVPVSFRSGKKRKAYRHRGDTADAPAESIDATRAAEHQLTVATTPGNAAAGPRPAADEKHARGEAPRDGFGSEGGQQPREPSNVPEGEGDDDDGTSGLTMAEILRRRNARKPRMGGGVGFGADSQRKSRAGSAHISDTSLVLSGDGGGAAAPHQLETIGKRFAPQTGIVGELVNRHMEEYIESELARRKRQAAEQQHQQDQQNQLIVDDSRSSRDSGAAVGEATAAAAAAGSVADRLGLSRLTSLAASGIKQPATSQPATRGKLHEIDLGEEARARNIALTERAKRRLNGGADPAEGGDDGGAANPDRKRTRLGPDGKPWRGGRNPQRGDDDIQRDRLVEQFLHENKVDMYDVAGNAGQGNEDEDEEMAADDRIAEQFRREFIDALVERRQQRRQRPINAPPRSATQRVNPDEILRGPKLGGSRNSRAQVRDALLKEQVEKRKPR